jgi:hypothetical protein
VKRYGREVSWIMKKIAKYRKKVNRIVKK